MKRTSLLLLIFICAACTSQNTDNKMNWKKLTTEEENIIVNKGTEKPFTGQYWNVFDAGTDVCKRCGTPLYQSSTKFESHCGWPSFDSAIEGNVKKQPDADGMRTEILCAKCGAHLGHVFYGEGFTSKDTRYCVNSASLEFIPSENAVKYEKAYYAAGCFWGVQHLMEKTKGVISTRVGYAGGHVDHPTYKQVCSGTTGHVETLEVVYNPAQVTYAKLTQLFFEIHDFTQTNGQGPDIGEQYHSVIFYTNDRDKEVADSLVNILAGKGYQVATSIKAYTNFWEAEDYHQFYYDKNGKQPYCHVYKKIF
jgi:peptide methionine sulfoxide reductase msrA/msrB